ncbi:MAG: hypothetical protein V3U84_01930 [Thiotrichaceae bacterium]
MKVYHIPQAILAVGIFGCIIISTLMCTMQIATADTSLAEKSLSQVSSSNASQAVTLTPPQTEPNLPTAPSKIETLVNTAQAIKKGAGVLGKNVAPIISKDIVGIQYSTKW